MRSGKGRHFSGEWRLGFCGRGTTCNLLVPCDAVGPAPRPSTTTHTWHLRVKAQGRAQHGNQVRQGGALTQRLPVPQRECHMQLRLSGGRQGERLLPFRGQLPHAALLH